MDSFLFLTTSAWKFLGATIDMFLVGMECSNFKGQINFTEVKTEFKNPKATGQQWDADRAATDE